MSLNKHTKDSKEILSEVRNQANTLRGDLNEIEGRLTPGQLLDDAIFYPHGKSLNQSFEHLKNNPMGSLFLGLGTLMLMERKDQTIEDHLKHKTQGMKENLQSAEEKVKSKTQELSIKAEDLKEEMENKARKAGKKLEKTAHQTGDFIQSISPFALAAIGLGLGAGIGNSIPVSNKEKELMPSDKFSKDLSSTLKRAGESVKNQLVDELKNIHF